MSVAVSTKGDPNGVVVDITENGWGGATKDVVAANEAAA